MFIVYVAAFMNLSIKINFQFAPQRELAFFSKFTKLFIGNRVYFWLNYVNLKPVLWIF
jgi:hypothetical protein